jgi:hypothetical protein
MARSGNPGPRPLLRAPSEGARVIRAAGTSKRQHTITIKTQERLQPSGQRRRLCRAILRDSLLQMPSAISATVMVEIRRASSDPSRAQLTTNSHFSLGHPQQTASQESAAGRALRVPAKQSILWLKGRYRNVIRQPAGAYSRALGRRPDCRENDNLLLDQSVHRYPNRKRIACVTHASPESATITTRPQVVRE